MMIKIPLASKQANFKEWCAKNNLQARGSGGFASNAADDGIRDVSNVDRMGKDEATLVNEMIQGVADLIKWEKDLESQGVRLKAKQQLLEANQNGNLEEAAVEGAKTDGPKAATAKQPPRNGSVPKTAGKTAGPKKSLDERLAEVGIDSQPLTKAGSPKARNPKVAAKAPNPKADPVAKAPRKTLEERMADVGLPKAKTASRTSEVK